MCIAGRDGMEGIGLDGTGLHWAGLDRMFIPHFRFLFSVITLSIYILSICTITRMRRAWQRHVMDDLPFKILRFIEDVQMWSLSTAENGGGCSGQGWHWHPPAPLGGRSGRQRPSPPPPPSDARELEGQQP